MIKDAIANSPNRLCVKLSSGLTWDRDSESIVHCILKCLFAPHVTLSCLDRSVAKQKLNLFQLPRFRRRTVSERSGNIGGLPLPDSSVSQTTPRSDWPED